MSTDAVPTDSGPRQSVVDDSTGGLKHLDWLRRPNLFGDEACLHD